METGLPYGLAPDDFHKANVSGGRPVHHHHPPTAAPDAPFEYEWHETTFVQLPPQGRSSGEGFPRLGAIPITPHGDKAIAKLTEGLLPL